YTYLAMRPQPLSPTHLPYTTLFRSGAHHHGVRTHGQRADQMPAVAHPATQHKRDIQRICSQRALDDLADHVLSGMPTCLTTDDRSEEHTSELQSREKLVCRLLLEKK